MEPGYREPGKPRRRVKKWQGASWTPPSANAELGEGEYCRRCKKTHGYMTLGMQVEQRGKREDGKPKWFIMWTCTQYGHVVAEVELGKANPDKPYRKIITSDMQDWSSEIADDVNVSDE